MVYGRENSGAGRASDSAPGIEPAAAYDATANSAVGVDGARKAAAAAEHPSMHEQV